MPLDSLSTLEITGLIRLAQMEPELEYLFRHALVQEAAYDSLLKADRRNIHLLTGKIMETIYAERVDELAAELARHFHEAGEHALAADYYTRAGNRARSIFANVEAAEYFRAALELRTEKRSDASADLHMNLGNVLFMLGRQNEAVAAHLAAANICFDLGDFKKCARCYNLISQSYFFAGDFQMQYAMARKGYELVKDEAETFELASLLRTMANASYFNGKAQEAIEYAEKALELSRRMDDIPLHSVALVTYGTVLPHHESAKKIEAMRKAADYARGNNAPSYSTAIFNYAETVFMIGGDWQTARDLFHEGMKRMREANALLAEFWQISGLQKALTVAGHFEEADQLEERVNELLGLIPDRGTVAGSLVVIKAVRAYYEGNHAQAIHLLEEGLSMAAQNNDQQLINEMGVWLAEIGMDVGNHAIANEILPKAIAAGDRNLIWGGVIPRCLLAAVHIHAGDISSAHAIIAEAKTRSQPDPGLMAQYALSLAQARLAAAESRWQDASDFYEQACEIANQMKLERHYQRALSEWNKIKRNA